MKVAPESIRRITHCQTVQSFARQTLGVRRRLLGLLALLRMAHVARARRRVIGPAERRLGPDVDVNEARARVDPDAHAAGVERLDERVKRFVGDARDADVTGRAVEVERAGAGLVAEAGHELDALLEV